jgi:sorbitol/mannitol transport system substrate-binding protein
MGRLTKLGSLLAVLLGSTALVQAEEITIATVNNGDMIIMQKLAPEWEKATGNKVNWVTLEENVLRQRVTTDIATKGGQFDIITIGAYETPIWGKQGWLSSLDDLGDDYDYNDVFEPLRNGLSVDGKLYAVPFYAESSFTLYRTDLFKQAGLEMPEKPNWDQIKEFADKLTDRSKEQYGICLRGKPGWGENMGLVSTIVNSFGGRWFDMDWKPQLTSEPWKQAITFYSDLLKADGPQGAASNGFNENQALFAQGKCAIWVDATSAAGRLYNKSFSTVGDKIGYAQPPSKVTDKGAGWFWAWSLAVPATTEKLDTAKSFVKWATSKEYVARVGETEGWVAAPPGTRKSTYENESYKKAAPFADMVLQALLKADPSSPTKDPVPYTGIQFVAIPEFQGIGTTVGQAVAAIVSGQQSVDQALGEAQTDVEGVMSEAGYTK